MALSGRRTDRVSLTLLLEVSGTDSHGQPFKEPSRTLLINRSGGVILLEKDLAAGQEIRLRRQDQSGPKREGAVRVVGQFGRQQEGFLYGVEIVDPATDLWGIEFPPIAESTEAVARMLLQCGYCRGREVAYLNEMELRGFESNRGIARYCRTCGVPSIWSQAPHEDEKKATPRGARIRRSADTHEGISPGEDKRDRHRVRLKTRLTACIRHSGSDDELAVCEDISPVGMCFRSKRRYDSNTQVDVAVPYSPDAANIFLPARIVYSEEIPKAGLFRHGTEYLSVPSRR
ncbi:MAG TPA: PilZ domain-containing protein [Candidatus Acidoferrales bacterium]|nr:PilZ domain-containing protein [Candidatus Acidoferrales bacterium]